MPLIRVEITTYQCPRCGTIVGRSRRRFGTPMARCGKCGTVFRTGLTNWTELSQGEKTRALIRELFLPTYLGKNVIYFYMFLAVALFLTLTGYDVWTLLGTLAVGGGLAGVGLLLPTSAARPSLCAPKAFTASTRPFHFSMPRFFQRWISASFLRMIAYCCSNESTLFQAQ